MVVHAVLQCCLSNNNSPRVPRFVGARSKGRFAQLAHVPNVVAQEAAGGGGGGEGEVGFFLTLGLGVHGCLP